MHSLGGGTGSGLGTYLLHLLADHFPEVYRYVIDVDVDVDDYNIMYLTAKREKHESRI